MKQRYSDKQVLELVAREPLTIRTMGQLLGVAGPSVQVRLNRLKAEGLITSEPRKRAAYRLTEAGKKVLDEAAEV